MELLDLMRRRQSSRAEFDPAHPVPDACLDRILEAARWAPTAHNMQNFEIVVIDDRAILEKIAAIRSRPSAVFLHENYLQLSFSDEELRQRGTGLLATMFPPSWRVPGASPDETVDGEHAFLGTSLRHCPTLALVLYDRRKRAPASEGDVLGVMSLGCVMQNMWLMAEALGLSLQILSTLGTPEVEEQVRRILAIPDHMAVGFACRLGHPVGPARYARVRRALDRFVHRNRY